MENEAGAETSRGVEGDRMRRCATGKAERRGLNRMPPSGSQDGACTQGSSRNLGWSLGAPVADRNGTAREIEPAGRREVGARSTSWDVGEPAPGDPAERRSAPENRTAGGDRK